MGKRVIGSNSHGFNNENLMVNELNGKRLKDLNSNLKKFIKDICIDKKILISEEMIIYARVESNNKLKQDFYISLDEKEFGVSLKMGTGNSVHQEKIEDFINWIVKFAKDDITDEIKDYLRFFIWADGSIDGKAPIIKDKDGNIIGRFGSKDFKKIYPEKREKLQNFLDNNETIILNRAIFEGRNNSKVDYVYHGNPLNGTWISKEEILLFNTNNPKSKDKKNMSALSVGRLSVQSWNVSLKGNTEHKRGQIQFKYGSMVDDFEKLMINKCQNIGTFEGDKEEFNLSKFLNRNKKHKFWKMLSEKCNLEEDKEDYYIVKIEGNKESKLTGKKVKCKSDEFIIKADISKDYLLQHEYQLTEKVMEDLDEYEVIPNSGISVKRADSSKYTIVKLTNNTFKKAFEKYIDGVEFIIFGLLVYTEKNKLEINKRILKDLNLKEDDVRLFYLNKYKINGDGILTQKFAEDINKKAKEVVREIIENNLELKESLFTGKGWFKNPYAINFVFKNGELTSKVYTDYTISNGSGRSRGIYTIILKPQ